MNTFRTMSRALVVTAVIFASNAVAADLNSIVASIATVINNKDIKPVVQYAAGGAGAILLSSRLAQEDPFAIATVTGLAVGALNDPKAGLISAVASLGISGVRAFVPNVEAVNSVHNALPKCLTSSEAKMVAQVVVAAAIGRALS